MRLRVLVFALLIALVAVPAWVPAAAEDGPDFTITLDADAPPVYDGPAAWFVLDESAAGERYVWHVELPEAFAVGDVRFPEGLFDVVRDQQVRPSVNISDDHYPLFHKFPRDAVWTADSPAQVYRFIDDGDDTILRLGFKGPIAGTFTVERDTTPPSFEVGPVEELVHFGFRQETRTDELARADLRIRPVDGGLALENPTPMFAYLQKFPVKGLDPETEYEAEVVFEDWSGNNVTSEPYTVTTPPRPSAQVPTIEVRSPLPNATGVAPDVAFEVAIEAENADSVDEVRLFVDLTQVKTGVRFEDGILRHTPAAPLEEGRHRASVEVYDVHGNMHHEQWAFWVGPGPEEATVPAVGLVPVALMGLVFGGLSRLVRHRKH